MTTPDISIAFEDLGSKGRLVATVTGYEEPAELTFSRAGETRIIVDHTGVPDSMRGLGVGVALAERIVGDARAQGLRIMPLCPFFKAQALRHPEWRDVVDGI